MEIGHEDVTVDAVFVGVASLGELGGEDGFLAGEAGRLLGDEFLQDGFFRVGRLAAEGGGKFDGGSHAREWPQVVAG